MRKCNVEDQYSSSNQVRHNNENDKFPLLDQCIIYLYDVQSI